jgi:hypothetical protein
MVSPLHGIVRPGALAAISEAKPRSAGRSRGLSFSLCPKKSMYARRNPFHPGTGRYGKNLIHKAQTIHSW